MKFIYSVVFGLLMLFLQGCDYLSFYNYYISNELAEEVELRFYWTSTSEYDEGSENAESVIIKPQEKKLIRSLSGPLNSVVHDCMNEHGMTYSKEIIFDTYINGEKLEKQLWQPQNWSFKSNSKYSGEYTMVITEDMVKYK